MRRKPDRGWVSSAYGMRRMSEINGGGTKGEAGGIFAIVRTKEAFSSSDKTLGPNRTFITLGGR